MKNIDVENINFYIQWMKKMQNWQSFGGINEPKPAPFRKEDMYGNLSKKTT
jgi:hypothetical protein